MAPNKVPMKAPAPAASYSTPEYETSSSDDEQTSNANNLPVPTTATPDTANPKIDSPKPAAASSSDDESEDDYTSDDDSDNPAHPSQTSASEQKLPSKAPPLSDSEDSYSDSEPDSSLGEVEADENGFEDSDNVGGEVKDETCNKRQNSTATSNIGASPKRQRRMTDPVVSGSENGLVNGVDTPHPFLSNIVDQLEGSNMGTSLMRGSYKIVLGMLKPEKVKNLEEKLKIHRVVDLKTYIIQLNLMSEVLLALEEALQS